MASLNEIKTRIGSVKSTLKITSAMKMVASAKLHKAQSAIEGMLPYEQQLKECLDELLKSVHVSGDLSDARPLRHVTLVCFASNSSLCGGFNANVIREVKSRFAAYKAEGVESFTVYSIGRKMNEAMRQLGFASPADYTELSGKPTYSPAAELAGQLVELFMEGKTDRVELVWNHFVNTAVQKPSFETFLPLDSSASSEDASTGFEEYIVEPGKEELVEDLLPKTLNLKIYATLLDASAAEHAARTVAMQAASDNAEDILQELSLEYNKGRQQKITSEILDLVGGMQQ